MKPRSNFRVVRYELCEYDHEFEETILIDHFIFGLHLKSTQKAPLREKKGFNSSSKSCENYSYSNRDYDNEAGQFPATGQSIYGVQENRTLSLPN